MRLLKLFIPAFYPQVTVPSPMEEYELDSEEELS